MQVDVVDTNDNTPQFVFDVNTSRYTAQISENAGASFILNFVATDADSTTNGMITFNFNSEFAMDVLYVGHNFVCQNHRISPI